jgi:predicted GTPase
MTHGGLCHGAGYVASIEAGAAEVVDPRAYAQPEIVALYAAHPHLGPVLPAMGYSQAQLAALACSINAVPADVVVSGTPVDLAALINVSKTIVRVRYEFAEIDTPGLGGVLDEFLARAGLLEKQ